MYELKYSQRLPMNLQECWDFFSSPANLKILTPEHLGFQIRNEQPNNRKMYAGQIISYTIKPLWNFPLEWVTEITHVQEPYYFIDEQRTGPYRFWHHEHRFNPIPDGVEMIDLLYYKMPFGLIGKAFHWLKVRQDIENIFIYRQAKLQKMFGAYMEKK
jgi:ligand-binding SRPBCC domain-containing protein